MIPTRPCSRCMSVMVTVVLLNVALMCAMPSASITRLVFFPVAMRSMSVWAAARRAEAGGAPDVGSRLLGHLLLARDGATRSLLRARIRVRPLPANRQPAPMADPAIRSDVHQALDVHRDFRPQRAFDAMILLDRLTKAVHVAVGQIANAEVAADAGLLENRRAVARPMPKMYVRPISTFFSRGRSTPADTCHISPAAACA